MANSPITGEDFDNQSFSGSVCDLFTEKLLSNGKHKEFLEWFLDSDGVITPGFAEQLIGLLQPIGSLMQAPKLLTISTNEWLLCDGATVNVADYPRLFAVLGVTFGGDGVNTFVLPDVRDRFLVGSGGTKAVGSTGGADTDTIDVDHQHVFGHHENPTNDDGQFLKGAVTPVRGSGAYIEVHGNTDSADAGTLTQGDLITDLPTDDLSAVSVDTIPKYMAVATYIKARFVINGNVL